MEEGAAAAAGGGGALRLTRAAHADLRMQWAVKMAASSCVSSATPLSTTLRHEKEEKGRREVSGGVAKR